MNPQTVEPIIFTSYRSWGGLWEGGTSEAVSGRMAIKPTQRLCFLLSLAYRSNAGSLGASDQTNGIFLKYY